MAPQPHEAEPASEPGVSQGAEPPARSVPADTTELNTDTAASPRQSLTRRTDFPYLMTLLFALLSWAVAHAADRVVELPLIKVTQETDAQAEVQGVHEVKLHLKNITSRVRFENLALRVLPPTDGARFLSQPITYPKGGLWGQSATLLLAEDGIIIRLPEFHPSAELTMMTRTNVKGDLEMRIEESNVPAMLRSPGLTTWLVERELAIIASILAVALIVLVAWTRNVARAEGRGRPARLHWLFLAFLLPFWSPGSSVAQTSLDQTDVEEIRVVDEDSGQGIPSYLVVRHTHDSEQSLGLTGADGRKELDTPLKCEAGMMIIVIPCAGRYYADERRLECMRVFTVRLTKDQGGTFVRRWDPDKVCRR